MYSIHGCFHCPCLLCCCSCCRCCERFRSIVFFVSLSLHLVSLSDHRVPSRFPAAFAAMGLDFTRGASMSARPADFAPPVTPSSGRCCPSSSSSSWGCALLFAGAPFRGAFTASSSLARSMPRPWPLSSLASRNARVAASMRSLRKTNFSPKYWGQGIAKEENKDGTTEEANDETKGDQRKRRHKKRENASETKNFQ